MTTGLDGVVVAQTVLSQVDGAQGRLIVRGHPIEALGGNVSFEAAAALLWEGLAPGEQRPEAIREALGQARLAAFERLAPVFPIAATLPAIEGLRLCLAALPEEDVVPAHLRVTAAIPVAIAATARLQRGETLFAPDAGLGHAADFLRMLGGASASAAEVDALDAYLVTVAEHGMNASTFTARVIASTRSDIVSAVVGALGALKGPLHGGAPGPVLDMLDAIERAERAPAWIAAELAAGRRLMGFGHRIYHVRDPRADVLKGVVSRLRAAGAGRLDFAEAVERSALEALAAHRPDRPLHTNVEFYTALLLEAIGLERALFTPVFAMGRVAGWTAHVFEQARSGRLLRPQSEYVGPVLEPVSR